MNVTLLAGCKTCEKVVSKSETTTTVTQRDTIIPIPERRASALGVIRVDDKGHFHIDRLKITNDNGTDVDISIDESGNFKADFVAQKDSAKAKITDTSTTTKEHSDIVKEKKPTLWDRFRSWVVITAIIICCICAFIVYNHFKKLWQ